MESPLFEEGGALCKRKRGLDCLSEVLLKPLKKDKSMFIGYDVAEIFIPFISYFVGKLWKWSDVTITPQGVKVYGAEYIGGPKVEFTEQIGVLLLGNDDDLLIDQGWINKSLGETLETLAPAFFSGNYTQFTWFGLRPVFQGKMGPLPAFSPMSQQPVSSLVSKAFIPFEDMDDEDRQLTSHLIMTEYIQVK
jgi:hypothetical protein